MLFLYRKPSAAGHQFEIFLLDRREMRSLSRMTTSNKDWSLVNLDFRFLSSGSFHILISCWNFLCLSHSQVHRSTLYFCNYFPPSLRSTIVQRDHGDPSGYIFAILCIRQSCFHHFLDLLFGSQWTWLFLQIDVHCPLLCVLWSYTNLDGARWAFTDNNVIGCKRSTSTSLQK